MKVSLMVCKFVNDRRVPVLGGTSQYWSVTFLSLFNFGVPFCAHHLAFRLETSGFLRRRLQSRYAAHFSERVKECSSWQWRRDHLFRPRSRLVAAFIAMAVHQNTWQLVSERNLENYAPQHSKTVIKVSRLQTTMQHEIQSLVKLLKRSQNCPINVLTWQDHSAVVIPSRTKVEGHLVRRFCQQIRVLTPAIMTSRPTQLSPPIGSGGGRGRNFRPWIFFRPWFRSELDDGARVWSSQNESSSTLSIIT